MKDEENICVRCGADQGNAGSVYPGKGYPGNGYPAGGYGGQMYYDGMQAEKEVKTRSAALPIASFVLSFFLAPIGVLLGIIALITKSSKKGFAVAGIAIGLCGSLCALGIGAVIVPQYMKYVEKSKVASDNMLCDSVRSAIVTAMLDPSVVMKPDNGIPFNSDWVYVKNIDDNTPFGKEVRDILGFPLSKADEEIKSHYQGSTAYGMQFRIAGSNMVEVRIEYSDSTGRKGAAGPNTITAW